MPDVEIRRGDIFYADLSPVVGSEQGGIRPVLILQNNVGNEYSPTTIVAAVTSRLRKAKLPTHVELPASVGVLPADSVILTEQVRTIDRSRMKQKVSALDPRLMQRVDRAVEISLGLVDI